VGKVEKKISARKPQYRRANPEPTGEAMRWMCLNSESRGFSLEYHVLDAFGYIILHTFKAIDDSSELLFCCALSLSSNLILKYLFLQVMARNRTNVEKLKDGPSIVVSNFL
jgi:hypothetical protein